VDWVESWDAGIYYNFLQTINYYCNTWRFTQPFSENAGQKLLLVLQEGKTVFTTSVLAAAVPTFEWSPKVAIVMIVCNVIAIALGKFTIKHKNVGLGLPSGAMFGGMGHGAMLGVTSLGHVLGAGAILGLASMGVL
jgi:photosystem I subunit X